MRFVLAMAALIVVSVGYGIWPSGQLTWPVNLAVDCLLLFCAACILCKRLHDRGRAGWWTGLILLAWAMVWSAPRNPLTWIYAPVLALAVVDLAMLPGQAAFNRFGLNPALS